MHPDIHRFLDGELPRTALSPEAAAELAAWEQLEGAVRVRQAERAPAWLADGVMRAVAELDEAADGSPALPMQAAGAQGTHGATGRLPADLETAGRSDGASPADRPAPWRRALAWLVTPRPVQVRPLAPLAAAAVLVLVVMMQTTPAPEAPLLLAADDVAAADETGSPVIYVQFTLTAQGARSVAVAGDFNDWSAESGALRDMDGSGTWRGLIAVQPGVHKYMFVVDGAEWVTDPTAERYVDDGFGMRNALLAVVDPAGAL